jgi:hypothetical protein
MKLHRNNKIKIKLNCKSPKQLLHGIVLINKQLAETNASLKVSFNPELTAEQVEYLQLINKNMEELRILLEN